MHKYRTLTCGEIRKEHIGKQVRLSGWLHNRRDLGGVEFLELRDHYGVTQLVVRPGTAASSQLASLPKETVLRIDGSVIARGEDNLNLDLKTGEVEVEVSDAEVLGTCESLPFSVFPEREVGGEPCLSALIIPPNLRSTSSFG